MSLGSGVLGRRGIGVNPLGIVAHQKGRTGLVISVELWPLSVNIPQNLIKYTNSKYNGRECYQDLSYCI